MAVITVPTATDDVRELQQLTDLDELHIIALLDAIGIDAARELILRELLETA